MIVILAICMGFITQLWDLSNIFVNVSGSWCCFSKILYRIAVLNILKKKQKKTYVQPSSYFPDNFVEIFSKVVSGWFL